MCPRSKARADLARAWANAGGGCQVRHAHWRRAHSERESERTPGGRVGDQGRHRHHPWPHTRHERRERAVAHPGRRERDDVDVEHELAGDRVDERALARAGHAVQEVAPAERDAAVGVPLNGRKGCVSSVFSSWFDTGEQGVTIK